jgi:hypothetical protein
MSTPTLTGRKYELTLDKERQGEDLLPEGIRQWWGGVKDAMERRSRSRATIYLFGKGICAND